jgi:hypothetical protein
VRAKRAQATGESRQAKSASTMSLSIWLARELQSELRSGAIPAQQAGDMNIRERGLIWVKLSSNDCRTDDLERPLRRRVLISKICNRMRQTANQKTTSTPTMATKNQHRGMLSRS